MRSMTTCVMAFLSLMVAGCSSVDMHRSCIGNVCELGGAAGNDAPKQCANATTSDPRKLCEKASIEQAKDFAIAYVELTDQGWFHDRKQLNAALNLLQPKGASCKTPPRALLRRGIRSLGAIFFSQEKPPWPSS